MILSVHIADLGARRALTLLRRPARSRMTRARYAETLAATPLRSGRLVIPQPGRVALIAAWKGDDELDRFLLEHPLAHLLRRGWQVRLEPLRSWGRWSALPDLPRNESSNGSDPVAVLTLGRLRLRRVLSFLATSAPAEREAVEHPAFLAGTALARPPRLVATFSLWRTTDEMREYALGHDPGGHRHAIQSHRDRAFHHEAVFARFRPYAAQGTWDGRNPLLDASA